MSWIFMPGKEPVNGKIAPAIEYPIGTWAFTNKGSWVIWSVYKDGTPDWWVKKEPEEVPKELRTLLLLLL